jgi:acyl carrier protein
MDPGAVREELRTFIKATLIRDASYPLRDDEPMITGGLIDSFSLAELAVFVERRFGVSIPDPELTVERMNTLDQIVARVLDGGAGHTC